MGFWHNTEEFTFGAQYCQDSPHCKLFSLFCGVDRLLVSCDFATLLRNPTNHYHFQT